MFQKAEKNVYFIKVWTISIFLSEAGTEKRYFWFSIKQKWFFDFLYLLLNLGTVCHLSTFLNFRAFILTADLLDHPKIAFSCFLIGAGEKKRLCFRSGRSKAVEQPSTVNYSWPLHWYFFNHSSRHTESVLFEFQLDLKLSFSYFLNLSTCCSNDCSPPKDKSGG